MANPYSIPTEYEYKPLPLEKFADVIQKKQDRFDTATAGVEDIKAGFKFDEGLLTPGLAEYNKQKYNSQIEEISTQLMEGESPTVIARRALNLQNQYNNDPSVKAGLRDAELSPNSLAVEAKYPGGSYGYKNKDGSYKTFDPANVKPTDIDRAYSDIAAPATFTDEVNQYKEIPATERESFSDIDPQFATNGAFLGYLDQKNNRNFKSMDDLMPRYSAALDVNFNNKIGSANYYIHSMGNTPEAREAYKANAYKMAKLLDFETNSKSRNFIGTPTDKNSTTSGTDVDSVAGITITAIPGEGTVAATNLSKDPDGVVKLYNEAQEKYKKLKTEGRTQEAEDYWNSPEAKIIQSSKQFYDLAKANYNQEGGNKIWDDYKKSVSGLQRALFGKVTDGQEFISLVDQINKINTDVKYNDPSKVNQLMREKVKLDDKAKLVDEYMKKHNIKVTDSAYAHKKDMVEDIENQRGKIEDTNELYKEEFKKNLADKHTSTEWLQLSDLSAGQETELGKSFGKMFKSGIVEDSSLEVFNTGEDTEVYEFDKSEHVAQKQKLIKGISNYINTAEGQALLNSNSIFTEKTDDGVYTILKLPGTVKDGVYNPKTDGSETTVIRTKLNPNVLSKDFDSPGDTGAAEQFLGNWSGMLEGIGGKEPTYDRNQFGTKVGDDLIYSGFVNDLDSPNVDFLQTIDPADKLTLDSETQKTLPKYTEEFTQLSKRSANHFDQEIKSEFDVDSKKEYVMFGNKFTGQNNNTILYKGNNEDFKNTGKLQTYTNKDMYESLKNMDEQELESSFNHAMVMQLVSSVEEDIMNNPTKDPETKREEVEILRNKVREAQNKNKATDINVLEALDQVGLSNNKSPFFFASKTMALDYTMTPKNSKKKVATELKPIPTELPKSNIVDLGKQLEGLGLRVSEHPNFMGITPNIHKGQGHALGKAIDVNVGKGVKEADSEYKDYFDQLEGKLTSMGYKVIWKKKGHEDHMHIEVI